MYLRGIFVIIDVRNMRFQHYHVLLVSQTKDDTNRFCLSLLLFEIHGEIEKLYFLVISVIIKVLRSVINFLFLLTSRIKKIPGKYNDNGNLCTNNTLALASPVHAQYKAPFYHK